MDYDTGAPSLNPRRGTRTDQSTKATEPARLVFAGVSAAGVLALLVLVAFIGRGLPGVVDIVALAAAGAALWAAIASRHQAEMLKSDVAEMRARTTSGTSLLRDVVETTESQTAELRVLAARCDELQRTLDFLVTAKAGRERTPPPDYRNPPAPGLALEVSRTGPRPSAESDRYHHTSPAPPPARESPVGDPPRSTVARPSTDPGRVNAGRSAGPRASYADAVVAEAPQVSYPGLERLIEQSANVAALTEEMEAALASETGVARDALTQMLAWVTWLEDKGSVLRSLAGADLVDKVRLWCRTLDYYLVADVAADLRACSENSALLSPQATERLTSRLQAAQASLRNFLATQGIQRIEVFPGDSFVPGVVERSSLPPEHTTDPSLHDRAFRVEPSEGGYRAGGRVLAYSLARAFLHHAA